MPDNHDRRVLLVNAFLPASAIQGGRVSQSQPILAAMPQLDRWKILPTGSVVGTVSGHPMIDDGDVITTSPVQNADQARPQAIVVTASGTEYKLLQPMQTPQRNGSSAAIVPSYNNFDFFNRGSSSLAPQLPSMAREEDAEAWKEAMAQYKLTTHTVGLEDEYILAGKATRSTSGKSNIWEAYRSDPNRGYLPMNGAASVCVKISGNIEAVSREYENYKAISFLGIARGRFVKCLGFYPVAGYETRFQNQCALVLEKGAQDLKTYLSSKETALSGEELRDACLSAAQCVQALHR